MDMAVHIISPKEIFNVKNFKESAGYVALK
jgi:hypothetical protein